MKKNTFFFLLTIIESQVKHSSLSVVIGVIVLQLTKSNWMLKSMSKVSVNMKYMLGSSQWLLDDLVQDLQSRYITWGKIFDTLAGEVRQDSFKFHQFVIKITYASVSFKLLNLYCLVLNLSHWAICKHGTQTTQSLGHL